MFEFSTFLIWLYIIEYVDYFDFGADEIACSIVAKNKNSAGQTRTDKRHCCSHIICTHDFLWHGPSINRLFSDQL